MFCHLNGHLHSCRGVPRLRCRAALLGTKTNPENSVGKSVKIAVAGEPLQNAGTDIEKTPVEHKLPGADRACDPREGHQIVERKPDRLVLANLLLALDRRH